MPHQYDIESAFKVTQYTFLPEVWALGATLTMRVCSRVICGTYKKLKQ